MAEVMTVSDVLARGVQVQWHEAVAVVRAVAEGVGESGRVPDLHQIEISSDGDVRIIGASRGDVPIARLGDLLRGLLVEADPPVKLRLIVTEATAPTPAFDSIQEFDQALGYYERPDRSAVVRGLYQRAAAGTVAPQPNAATSESPTRVTAFEDKPAQPRPARANRRVTVLIGSAAVAAIICAIALRVSGVGISELRTGEIWAAGRRVSETVGRFALSSLSAVTQRLGLGRLASSTETTSTEPPSTPEASPPPDASPERPATSKASAPPSTPIPPVLPAGPEAPLVAFDLEPAPMGVPSAAEPLSPTVAGTERQAEEPIDESTYSAESPDVVPPVGVRPQLPRDLPPGVRREDLVSIEVVVLQDGTVESVKLLSEPQNVYDFAWLSAVKAWQFRPALKNGRPVRYQKVIWIAAR